MESVAADAIADRNVSLNSWLPSRKRHPPARQFRLCSPRGVPALLLRTPMGGAMEESMNDSRMN